MTDTTLAADYADTIARELWRLDETGVIWPHYCPDEDSCDDSEECYEARTASGYLDTALDIEITRSLPGDYRGARILIAYGGPDAWIDTRRREVEVSWDNTVRRAVPPWICEALDEYLEEVSSYMY